MTQEAIGLNHLLFDKVPIVSNEEDSLPLVKGDKRLKLFVDPFGEQAQTKIETIEGTDPEPGATTFLYERALRVMKDLVNEYRIAIVYYFYTTNPKMIAWAKDRNKGMRIFNWDYLREEQDPDTGIIQLDARKCIHPSNHQ